MMTMEAHDRARLMQSSFVSLAFWLVLAIVLALVPFSKPKPVVPEYKTVRLTLNVPAPKAAPAAAPAQTAPAAESAPATSVPAKAAPEKTVPAKATPAKAAPALSRSAKAASKAAAKASSAPAKTTSTGGLGIPNFTAPVTGSAQSDATGEYLDFTSTEQRTRTEPASPAKGSSVSELEGVAAPLASASTAKGASASTQKSASSSASGAGSGAASGETEKALGEITGAAKQGAATSASSATGSTATGTTSATGSKTGTATSSTASSSVSALSFEGSSRKLIQPAKPSITLPDDLARLVTSNRTVTVSFAILADGSVPPGRVEFTPSAILPAQVRDWLAKEFSTWRFEKSGEDGQARFAYSIKVE
jgi:hypothetical protein